MAISIRTTTDGIDFHAVAQLLSFWGLSNENAETQQKIFSHSYAVAFLFENDKLIGTGRALSDGISQAAIYNLALAEAYCGQGLGKRLLDALLEQVIDCNVILYTHPKWIGLYEHWGFSKMKTGYALYTNEDEFREEGFI